MITNFKYGKINSFSVKSTFLLKKLLKSWFHEFFWAWSCFLVLFNTVAWKFRQFDEFYSNCSSLLLSVNLPNFLQICFRQFNEKLSIKVNKKSGISLISRKKPWKSSNLSFNGFFVFCKKVHLAINSLVRMQWNC